MCIVLAVNVQVYACDKYLKSEYHLRNYGDQGGCYPKQMLLFVWFFSLRIIHSKISIIVQIIETPNSITIPSLKTSKIRNRHHGKTSFCGENSHFLLLQLSCFVNQQFLIKKIFLFFNVLIKLTMLYGSCLWTMANVKRVFKLQKRAAYIILHANIRDRSKDLFRRLDCLLFKDKVNL